jgi:chitinase
MKKVCLSTFYLLVALLATAQSQPHKKAVIGYVFGSRLLDVSQIEAHRLTHINYAFAVIVENEVVPSPGNRYDEQNIPALQALKRQNPDLKILTSIGGWGGSGGFSDAALSPESRAAFTRSALAFMQRHQFDGIDIDWEYPAQPGAGNPYRAEDQQNFTLLMQSLRNALDSLAAAQSRKPYLLTIAAAAGQRFIDLTEMSQVARYLDFATIMSYDFTGAWSKETGHHSNLYASKIGKGSTMDGAKSAELLITAGVPADKLALGAAFYGKAWAMPNTESKGLYQTALRFEREYRYHQVRDSLIAQAGYKRFWDKDAKAHYLFHPSAQVFVSYESPRAIRHKMRYIRRRGLKGVMFWEYFGDPAGDLLKQMR